MLEQMLTPRSSLLTEVLSKSKEEVGVSGIRPFIPMIPIALL
jgi:hypothetical protein